MKEMRRNQRETNWLLGACTTWFLRRGDLHLICLWLVWGGFLSGHVDSGTRLSIQSVNDIVEHEQNSSTRAGGMFSKKGDRLRDEAEMRGGRGVYHLSTSNKEARRTAARCPNMTAACTSPSTRPGYMLRVVSRRQCRRRLFQVSHGWDCTAWLG